jgi:DNA-binding transcriptional MerR regulator
MTDDLTLEDLVVKSSLSIRTLRYYMQEGLLPGPDKRGKYARYSQYHLDRIELIQRFKKINLPLQQIRHLLNNMTADEINQLLQSQDRLSPFLDYIKMNDEIGSPMPSAGSSALEYIHDLEAGWEQIQAVSSPIRSQSTAPKQPSSIPPSNNYSKQSQITSNQETWKRIIITEGIELNVKEPKNADEEAKIDKLIAYTRRLFGNQS